MDRSKWDASRDSGSAAEGFVDRCLVAMGQRIGGAAGLCLGSAKVTKASDPALAPALAAQDDVGEGLVIDVLAGALAVWSPDLAEADKVAAVGSRRRTGRLADLVQPPGARP